MKDLLIHAAKEMPEKTLVELLEKALSDYKKNASDHNKMEMLSLAFMVTVKFGTSGTADSVISEAALAQKGLNLLKPNKN